MEFDFLEGPVALTKSYARQDDGSILADQYPMVRSFTSHRESVSSIDELYKALTKHAAQNHCLLKGLLARPIVRQSRAGLTSAGDETTWMLLDLDFTGGFDSIDAVMDALGLGDVSYIFQHSSSAGIKGEPGIRGHIWVLLSRAVTPAVLKLWLREQNFNVPELARQFQLSVNKVTLKWPLDISTCQNDKLIYIAPPVCVGFDAPALDRFVLVKKGSDTVAPPKPKAKANDLRDREIETIAHLRTEAGLPTKDASFKKLGKHEILVNPDQCTISGMKTERGFTYLNLNGGDSWGYYFPADKPDLVFNFKNEPVIRLRDIAPAFYDEYTIALQSTVPTTPGQETPPRPFVFRDWAKDTYYNALYYPDTQRLVMAKAASIQRLAHFMLQHDQEPPEVIEDWTVEFDPTTTQVVDFNNRWINTFVPTSYLLAEYEPEHVMPPLINRIIHSICGDDSEMAVRFTNWVAHIFQTRRKTGTAWIFHGVQGTGKGVFTTHVLKPLLGSEHVVELTAQNIEEQFNAALEKAIILMVDEFSTDSSHSGDRVMAKLKNLVTEERIALRAMRQDATMCRNHTNVIIATNKPDPVRLDTTDRRFNVCPAQETPLQVSNSDEFLAAIESELDRFAAFLRHYKVDQVMLRKVLHNTARRDMIIAGQTTVDRFFAAVRTGDLDFFLDYIGDQPSSANLLLYGEFEPVLIAWVRAGLDGPLAEHFVSPSDMQKAYAYIIGAQLSPAKLGRLAAIHRLPKSRHSDLEGSRTRGYLTRWRGDKVVLETFLRNRAVQKPKLVKTDAA